MPEDPPPTLLSRLVRKLLLRFYRSRGWRATGQPPADRRCVIIAVPHTSNWDFVNFLGVTDALGVKAHFMGKAGLFRWPMGRFMRDMGGVPVDRGGGRNQVEAMVAKFARREHFMLTIAPEGTRGGVKQWRSGFYHIYHIAMAAGVPLVCGTMDYATKTGGLGPAIMPTGDYAADMAKIFEYYRTSTPRHPDRAIGDLATIVGAGSVAGCRLASPRFRARMRPCSCRSCSPPLWPWPCWPPRRSSRGPVCPRPRPRKPR